MLIVCACVQVLKGLYNNRAMARLKTLNWCGRALLTRQCRQRRMPKALPGS